METYGNAKQEMECKCLERQSIYAGLVSSVP